MDDSELLSHVDSYLDEAPLSATEPERVGPFTLFVRRDAGWPYYARPTPGCQGVQPSDVDLVRVRQRALGLPETFEWIVDVVPSVGPAATESGLAVSEHPLMYLDVLLPSRPPDGFEVRMAEPQDDLAMLHAVAEVGFRNRGTAPGPAGVADAEEIVSRGTDAKLLATMHERWDAGLTVSAAAFDVRTGKPVAVGAHQPLEGTTEIVGVATLPAFRRRGLGAAVTSALVRDALMRNCHTVFLTADDDAVARVYQDVGFRRIGTAGSAEPVPVRTSDSG